MNILILAHNVLHFIHGGEFMATVKTATARARIDPVTKRQAESIFKELGLTVSGAYNLFYKQVIAHKGLPFSVEIPNKTTLNAMDEDRLGKGKRYKNLKELYKDLGI